ncbi:AraC family transcriptional regulator [Oscillospiraceae bacterium 50-60]
METPEKQIVCDRKLQIEGCLFRGLTQPFPTHFHGHYVLGLVENGVRTLSCRGREWTLRPGCLMLLNPGDSHACSQREGALDYRGVNIPIEAMLALSPGPAAGTLPVFPTPVVENAPLAEQFRTFHRHLMSGGSFAAEEALLLFLSGVLEPVPAGAESAPAGPKPSHRKETEAARTFLEEHFAEGITLDQLCRCAGLSKSTLLRSFTREMGITPYRYLETLRVNAAKALLEQGVPPLEAALRTGFSDQSHFTNSFTSRIGLPPGMYCAGIHADN